MVHPTPEQDEVVEKSNWQTIRSAFKEYETTLVVLHPFLKIKPNCDIKFETGNWPSKEQIVICTENITWAEIINKSELEDINELDRLLAYLHCARRTADKIAWIKLNTLLDKNDYVAAQVDCIPEILINCLMAVLTELGYSKVLEFTEHDEFRRDHTIEDILTSKERDFYVHARITTPDKKICIATDFDQRFSYLSSHKEITNQLIERCKLEGFYCNETTRPDWSYIEQTENTIDWNSPERSKNYA